MPYDPERVEALFEAARDLPLAEREALLSSACPGDLDLRARVERLLAAHAELGAPAPTGTFHSDELTATFERRADAQRAVDPISPHDQERTAGYPSGTPLPIEELPAFPGYEVLGVLGEGGMGVVYKARQLAVGRTVALKTIRGGLGSAVERERFRAEAEAAAKLTHPGIARVYEYGECRGVPYFTMELCESGALTARLDGTPWPVRAAARLAEMLSDAVAAAHRRGIVHRDLKPANVLLARGDGPEEGTVTDPRPDPLLYAALRVPHGAVPKVTDFGISKRVDGSDGVTATGAVMGTPCYMSPEQARGESRSVGPPADVYALGAILYELLTGRPPFRGATVVDTLDQVRAREPVAVRALNPVCPRDLETICLKCLQKEPGKRYAGAAELADDLRRFQEGRPIAARPVGAAERAWRWCRRNPAVASLVVAVTATLVSGIAATTWGLFRALDAERDARAKEKLASDERDEKEKARAAEEGTRKGLELQLVSREVDEVTAAETANRGREELLLLYARLLPTLPAHAADLRYFLTLKTIATGLEICPTVPYHLRIRGEYRTLCGVLPLVLEGKRDGSLLLSDPLTGAEKVTFRVPGAHLMFATHSDDRTVFVAHDGNVLYFFDLRTGRLLSQTPKLVRKPPLHSHAERVPGQISPDARRCLSRRHVHPDIGIELWDTMTGRLVAFMPDNVLANYARNGKWVVCYGNGSGSTDVSPVRVYSAEDGSLVRTIPPEKEGYLYASVTPSGKYLVTFTRKHVRWWRTTDWQPDGNPVPTTTSTFQTPTLWSGGPASTRHENQELRRRHVHDDYAVMIGRERDSITELNGVEIMVRGQERPIQFKGTPLFCDREGLLLDNGQYVQFNPVRVSVPERGRRYAPELRARATDGRFVELPEDSSGLSIDFAVEKPLGWRVKRHIIDSRGYLFLWRGDGPDLTEIRDFAAVPDTFDRFDPDLIALWAGVVAGGELDKGNVFRRWDEEAWEAKRRELERRIAGRPEADVMRAVVSDPFAAAYRLLETAETPAKALVQLDRIVRDDPSPSVYRVRTLCRTFTGDIDGAIADQKQFLRLWKQNTDDRRLRIPFERFLQGNDASQFDLFARIVYSAAEAPERYRFVVDWAADAKAANYPDRDPRLDFYAELARYRLGEHRAVREGIRADAIKPLRNQFARALGTGSPLTAIVLDNATLAPVLPWEPNRTVLLALCEFAAGEVDRARTRLAQVRDSTVRPELLAEARTTVGVPSPSKKP